MSKTLPLVALLAVCLAAVSGWSVAQQPPPRPAPPPPPGVGPRYTVTPLGDRTAILLETASGKTWRLEGTPDGTTLWVPMRRIDSEEEGKKFHEELQKARRGRAEREQVK